METIEYEHVDKSEWGAGPWHDEPDKVQYEDDETGLPCLVVRVPRMGHLCGYVGVPPDHSLHGVDYAACPEDCDSETFACDHQPCMRFDVHGGLTFAGDCHDDEPEESAICHTPGEGDPDDVWWFGYDCAHAWDRQPGMEARHGTRPMPDEHYRSVAYVKQENAKLAQQLLEAGGEA